MRAIVLLGLVLAAFLVAAPAHANFPASVQTTVAPGGHATVSSPSLPPGMKAATVDVAPATPAEDPLFANLRVTLSSLPSPRSRLITCVSLYVAFTTREDRNGFASITSQPNFLAALVTAVCLEIAGEVNRAAAGQRATAAAAGCGRSGLQVPAVFTRVGRKYRVTTGDTLSPLTAKGRLLISCRRKGAGMSVRIRPRSRRASLRSIVGDRLALGVLNPVEATGSARVRFTFRR